jgi:hypothetical protein
MVASGLRRSAAEGAQRKEAIVRSRAYDDAWARFLPRSGLSESDVRAALSKAGTSASGNGSKSSFNSPVVSAEGFQTPPTRMAPKPGDQTNTIEGSEQSTYAGDIEPSAENIGISGAENNVEGAPEAIERSGVLQTSLSKRWRLSRISIIFMGWRNDPEARIYLCTAGGCRRGWQRAWRSWAR